MQNARILVVDDEKSNIDLLVHTLMPDYQTLVAKSGPEALQKAFDLPLDIILLDIMMPGMNGFEVLQRLKEEETTREIPVIFLTAMSNYEDESFGIKLGAADYIKKPFNPEVVKVRIQNQLEICRAREELKEQNRLLQENMQLREQIEAITRHDLKAPLNAVIGLPELIFMDGENLTPDQVENVQMIKESGYKMLNMINRSLDMYKMEKGSYEFTPQAVDLTRVLENLIREYAPVGDKKKIALAMEYPEDIGQDDKICAYAEELLCYSLLSNLLNNAIEAGIPGETILLDLSGQENEVCVCIRNRQPIPEEIRESFFDKHVTRGKSSGTGLGTYSAWLMTWNMNGRIEFASSQEQGTSVCVFLPRSTKY